MFEISFADKYIVPFYLFIYKNIYILIVIIDLHLIQLHYNILE